MAPACQILHWALALGLGLTFEVTYAFRSQGRVLNKELQRERSVWCEKWPSRVGGGPWGH